MALNFFLIKKWTNMMLGNSPYHVNQNEGLIYSKNALCGYYNNLTEKITRFGMPGDDVPITQDEDGSKKHSTIGIFQYGLAAYDLYLLKKDDSMLRKMRNCADWALDNQESSGAWRAFYSVNSNEPYSAMAQGEGISLLVRSAMAFNEKKYLDAATNALHFLLLDRSLGGVCVQNSSNLYLYEFTFMPIVLNGWIFAAWGLLDYYKATGDLQAKEAWNKTVNTIAKSLKDFDCGYWSKYNIKDRITSPFYHNLHIAQLNVLYDLTGNVEFEEYAKRWKGFKNNKIYMIAAFIVKAIQKLKE
jgi:hypothetical protein